MRLSELSYGVVYDVVMNAHDLEQIYVLRGERDPVPIIKGILAAANFSWAAWHGGRPVAVFGAAQVHDGVWQVYMLTTNEFPKIAIPLTRFGKRTFLPTLFGQIGAHRVEAVLHEKNVAIHRWCEILGFRREFVKKGYATDGSAYSGYAICKGTIDSLNPTE